MKSLVEFVEEHINESNDQEVYAIIDFTDAIQGVYNTQEEADKALKDMPKEANAKIKKMKKSEVES